MIEENDTNIGAMEAALDLLRRLPPQNIEQNVLSLAQLLPQQHTSELFNTVDLPCKVKVCSVTAQEYLACDYNRDGDSYRSPWSNEYEPKLTDEHGNAVNGLKPSERLRKMEIIANEAFNTYKSLYYEGGISSVYFWDVPCGEDKDCFAATVLIKKEIDSGRGLKSGAWDSIHVLEVEVDKSENKAHYNLTTTVILHLDSNIEKLDSFLLSGSITRQSEKSVPFSNPIDEEHIVNLGKMIEDMESKMRSSLQEIYFGKTHDVINEIRPVLPAGFLRHQSDLQKEIASKIGAGLGPRVLPFGPIPLRSPPPPSNNVVNIKDDETNDHDNSEK